MLNENLGNFGMEFQDYRLVLYSSYILLKNFYHLKKKNSRILSVWLILICKSFEKSRTELSVKTGNGKFGMKLQE